MPFKNIRDAEKSSPGLKKYSGKAKRVWLEVFNKCMEDGNEEGSCFARAYGTANKIDGRKSKESSIAAQVASWFACRPNRWHRKG